MITHSTSQSHTTRVELERENRIEMPVTAGMIKEYRLAVSRRQILKWFGAVVSVLLSIAALAPNLLRIPANLQSWVFLTAIFWILAFCAGMFDL
jgi:hypothetical protein